MDSLSNIFRECRIFLSKCIDVLTIETRTGVAYILEVGSVPYRFDTCCHNTQYSTFRFKICVPYEFNIMQTARFIFVKFGCNAVTKLVLDEKKKKLKQLPVYRGLQACA